MAPGVVGSLGGEQTTSLTRTGPDWRKKRPTPLGGSLCQESASGDPDDKGSGSGRWAGGTDKAAGKDLLLGRGAMRPVAGVTVETPRRIQSLTYSLNTYLLPQAQCQPWKDREKGASPCPQRAPRHTLLRIKLGGAVQPKGRDISRLVPGAH